MKYGNIWRFWKLNFYDGQISQNKRVFLSKIRDHCCAITFLTRRKFEVRGLSLGNTFTYVLHVGPQKRIYHHWTKQCILPLFFRFCTLPINFAVTKIYVPLVDVRLNYFNWGGLMLKEERVRFTFALIRIKFVSYWLHFRLYLCCHSTQLLQIFITRCQYFISEILVSIDASIMDKPNINRAIARMNFGVKNGYFMLVYFGDSGCQVKPNGQRLELFLAHRNLQYVKF